jgi:NAD-dependent dihydropyrimidine dehydrogenase PreA subunit
MIELLLEDRCTACNACVAVCPSNVFDRSDAGPPRIARQADCQTCFMCELYCQDDALYVHPDSNHVHRTSAADAVASGTLGQYRRHSGWDEWEDQFPNEQWRMELVFRQAAEAAASATRS